MDNKNYINLIHITLFFIFAFYNVTNGYAYLPVYNKYVTKQVLINNLLAYIG